MGWLNDVIGQLNNAVENVNKAFKTNIPTLPTFRELSTGSWNEGGIIRMSDPTSPWMRSPKAKLAKDGSIYLHIPFKHKTREMPSGMYRIVKQMNPSVKGKTGDKVSEFNRIGEQVINKLGKQIFDKQKETHKSGLFEGMIRSKVKTTKTGKDLHEYITFRTVSTKSPAGTWIIDRRDTMTKLTQSAYSAMRKLSNLFFGSNFG